MGPQHCPKTPIKGRSTPDIWGPVAGFCPVKPALLTHCIILKNGRRRGLCSLSGGRHCIEEIRSFQSKQVVAIESRLRKPCPIRTGLARSFATLGAHPHPESHLAELGRGSSRSPWFEKLTGLLCADAGRCNGYGPPQPAEPHGLRRHHQGDVTPASLLESREPHVCLLRP